MYYLIWNNEVIEEHIESLEEAEYLRAEYAMAYKGNVVIKKEKG